MDQFLKPLLSVLFAPAVVAAQAADRFDSPACRAALQHLHQVEEARRAERGASPAQGGAGPLVEQARRDAARHCLGGSADAERPARQAFSPPVPVEAIRAPSVADPPGALRPMLPAPPLAPSRAPALVSHCDSAGCWTSDGRYLLRVGPELAGPGALCSIQAGVLHCR